MYYSRQLFEFVKTVLYVIPVNIFKELDAISSILSNDLRDLDVKINKDLLKEMSKPEKRYELAERTH